MLKRLGVMGALVAIGALAVGSVGPATGQGTTGTVQVLSSNTEQRYVDVGRPGFSLGDAFVFTSRLTHHDVRVGVLGQQHLPAGAVALHRVPQLRQVHPVLVDLRRAFAAGDEQVRGVRTDQVALRVEDRPVGPGDGGGQLLGRELEADVDQPQRRPDVVGERVLELVQRERVDALATDTAPVRYSATVAKATTIPVTDVGSGRPFFMPSPQSRANARPQKAR